MNENNTISLLEQEQVVEDLYMRYIRHIEVPEMKWNFETFPAQEPSITFIQMSTAMKNREFIGGAYEAELPFAIVVRIKADDTRSTLDATKYLNALAITFEDEKNKGFPELKLTNATPLDIEMTSTPARDDETKDGVAEYTATYSLKFKKKGRYS